MPISQNPAVRGFIPAGPSYKPQYVRMRPTRGKNNAQIRKGDVVYLGASANTGIQRYHDVASGAASRPVLGVVLDVLNADRRPFTFNQPGAGPFIPTSSTGFALVLEDPDATFVANCSSTAVFSDVGRFASIRVSAPNTAVGRSGMSLGSAAIVANATAVGEVAKIVSISPMDTQLQESPVCGFANQDLEVLFVNHQWRNKWARDTIGAKTSG